MRHLKLRAELIKPECVKAKVTIVEQTHTGNNFSEKGQSEEQHHTGVFRRGRVDFNACNFADSRGCLNLSDGQIDVVLGNTNTFEMPAEFWPEVKEAVKLYNDWGKDKD